MKPKLYLETSIGSYLTSRPNRDVIITANQQLAHEWWETRDNFDIFISELVIDESSKGDVQMAQKRLDLIQDFPLIDFNDEARDLAKEILRQMCCRRKLHSTFFTSPRQLFTDLIFC
ncbi:hypothetical protein BH10ACI1_BH10ACI1_09360 [soil metagenome]